MEEALVAAVRITHIASAIGLAGGGFLWTIVLAPTLSKKLPGPRVGEIMNLLGPAMGRYLSILAYVVFLSGATLLASIVGWRHVLTVLLGGTFYGTVLLLGILAFLGGLVLGEGVVIPTGKRLSTMGPGSDPALAQRLARKQGAALVAISVLDFAALAMMALAVNARA